MNSAEREIIDQYSPEITQDAIPVDMLPYLPCLTQSDKEIITREETNKGPFRAAMELLSRVRRRRGAFRELVFALRASGCGHIADLLHPVEQGMYSYKTDGDNRIHILFHTLFFFREASNVKPAHISQIYLRREYR